MPKAKKFIDRKNAVTFHLVHRSQKDPLAADENAPQHVLVEAADKQQKGEVVVRKEEERKWGVFFDDEYDYLQHLKDAQDVSVHWAPAIDPSKPPPPKEKNKSKKNVRLNLPSSVFASEIEEDVGLLNKAAPQSGLRLDLDPDVVAAMDEDFDFDNPDNQLEDDFMEMAMKEGDHDDDEEYTDDEGSMDSQQGYGSDNQLTDSEGEGDLRCLRGRAGHDRDDDNKSRFSQYSMSSSIMRRNNGLTMLDDRFEKMFAEYDDTEIGALDCEDIEGHLSATPEVLLKCAEQFSDQRRLYKLDEAGEDKEMKKIVRMRGIAEEEEEIKDEDLFGTQEEEQQKWDCESILSTYSNIYNHPKLIDEPKREKKIKISAKSGIPLGVIDGSDSGRVTLKSLARFNMQQEELERGQGGGDEGSVCGSLLSTLSVLSLRPADETPEDRRERKRLLREFRQERRVEKKANSQAFKEEKKLQEKISVNNRHNVQGIKIV